MPIVEDHKDLQPLIFAQTPQSPAPGVTLDSLRPGANRVGNPELSGAFQWMVFRNPIASLAPPKKPGLKPIFVGIYVGESCPFRVLGWCEMDFVHPQ